MWLKKFKPEILIVVENKKILLDLQRKANPSTIVSNTRCCKMTTTNDANDSETSYRNYDICKKHLFRVYRLADNASHGRGSDREGGRDRNDKKKWTTCHDSKK